MSRFDLFFVVLDDCNESVDISIAKYILDMHRRLDDMIESNTHYTTEQLQRFFRYAKTFKPQVSLMHIIKSHANKDLILYVLNSAYK
jgi:DNA replication licensing factor MCM6